MQLTEAAKRQRAQARWGPLLFVVAAFASAFLIFLVQPMVGKRIVPWFGGAPAVWTVCLAFYQTVLFAGYAYAHALIRGVPPRLQLPAHALAVGGALLALPVLPTEPWRGAGADEPSAAILAMLSVHVALPFFALAATGPLAQAWFARCYPSRSPYPLYAVSNLGSFLALLAYPLLVEPRLSLSHTGRLWSLAFAATGVAVLACAALARGAATSQRSTVPAVPAAAGTGAARVALWIALPACAVVLMMGVTNALTRDVASVPFLWILPLGVYLTTFVLCFASERSYRRIPYVLLAAAPILASALISLTGLGEAGVLRAISGSIQLEILIHVSMLFGACMVLHGEVYRLRPPASSLTAFYLCLSGGGALGGLFVGVLAPRIFDDYYEMDLGFALAWLLFLAACWQDVRGWRHRNAPRWRWAFALALTAILLPRVAAQRLQRPESVVHQERTFFGLLRVWHSGSGQRELRQLFNGTTLHGLQFPGLPRRPTSYFGAQTGIGLALGARDPDRPIAIGIVGLGIGTLAAYGRPGDRIRFYEIDPAVIRLARDGRHFTYLAQSRAEIEVVEGDARISLASERERGERSRFDFLIVDAFTSDAIPLHLLTREAFALYLEALAAGGLLAVHASNRHFDLIPVLARLGDDAGLHVASIETPTSKEHLSARSTWVFLARDEKRIRSLARLAKNRRRRLGLPAETMTVQRPAAGRHREIRVWTDDYSDLFGAMRPLLRAPGPVPGAPGSEVDVNEPTSLRLRESRHQPVAGARWIAAPPGPPGMESPSEQTRLGPEPG